MNSHYKTEWTEPVRYVGLDVSKARLGLQRNIRLRAVLEHFFLEI